MRERFTISSDHPVMRDHLVLGKPVLSGLGYIDLIYQVFHKHGHSHRGLELRDLVIYRPLVATAERSVRLNVQIVPGEDENWRVEAVEDTEDDKAAIYATARMRRGDQPAFEPERLDLRQLRLGSALDLEEIYAARRQDGLVHGDFMKVRGSAYADLNAVYVDCGLSPEAALGAEQAMFHPALLDGAAVCGGSVLGMDEARSGPGALVLPLHYRTFRAARRLNGPLTARIKRDSARRKNDLSYFTLEFFDPDGVKIAELDDLGGKVVRDNAAFAQPSAQPTSIRRPEPARRAAKRTPAKAPSALEARLASVIAGHLGRPIDTIDPHLKFFDLGIDSKGLLALVQQIGDAVGRTLAPTLLFEYATIAELAEHLGPGLQAEPEMLRPMTESAGKPFGPTQSTSTPGASDLEDDIAIIAIEGRFPGANSTEALWENLLNHQDSIVEVPEDRWALHDFYDPEPERAVREGRSYSKWGGFFRPEACAGLADAAPGHELLLRIVEGLLSGAKVEPDRDQEKRIGVYLGAMADAVGDTKPSELVNAISSACGFQGPSIAIDTMSSSAMTALHMACESLRRGECEAAVVASLYLLKSSNFVYLCRHRLLGSRADSRSFAEGDGLLLSETLGAVVLKPVSAARRDGDPILAVIRSSAVNHAGSAAGGFGALQRLFSEVLERGRVAPQTIGCVEASANGSAVGDAVEFAALARALTAQDAASEGCVIGSVKSNIGHAAAASGFSQLAKIVLQLQHQRFAPSIKLERMNRNISLEGAPFRIVTEASEWRRATIEREGRLSEIPRRALISSMGGGGSYGCVVLEEYDPLLYESARGAASDISQRPAFEKERQ